MSSDTLLPTATYRIQLTKDFTFDDTAAIAPYLKDLGISHLYLSPIFESVPGSMHGYDVLDFSKISVERGGEDGFKRLNEVAGKLGLKIILDIVPNHMSASPDNPYWRDVLKNGGGSPYWHVFDIRVSECSKIELPVLGDNLKDLLDKNEISIEDHAAEGRHIAYQGKSYPLNPSIKGNDIESVLSQQHYEFVHWSKAARKICYRRFFNITDLIGVRVEDKKVFDLTHAKIFELLKQYPTITGLRVDHIDGLAKPAQYLDRLRKHTKHVWVEKILATDENLLPWPVEGTTGYEFIGQLNKLMVDPVGFEKIKTAWIDNSHWKDFDSCVADSKKEVLNKLFSYEMKRLSHNDRDAHAFWEKLTIALPIYRTYWDGTYDNQGLKFVDETFAKSGLDKKSALAKLLLSPETMEEQEKVIEWQQLSGPAMAKGLEDTAHYRFTPLAALNEVGCEADLKNSDFFDWMNERAEQSPHTLNATSTHDTKRSEDVRHRLYALADQPEKWIDLCNQFKTLSAPYLASSGFNDPSTENFLYQAILGAWPNDNKIDQVFIDRIKAYLVKSAKEAKLRTSWTEPDQSYETSLTEFIDLIFNDRKIIQAFSEFSNYLSWAGAINSLSVQTLKILSPGVPDFYNGTEAWDLSLVDPDNRRPIDFKRNFDFLNQTGLQTLTQNWRDGAIKLWLTRKLLEIRKAYFRPDDTLIISDIGTNDALVVYRLTSQSNDLTIILPRYPGRYWNENHTDLNLSKNLDLALKTDLNLQQSYMNLITNRPTSLTEIGGDLNEFPVAVLAQQN